MATTYVHGYHGRENERLQDQASALVDILHSDTSYPADLVVLGLGVRPNTALAAAAGLPLGETGGIRVDHRMRVLGQDGVWAAGDCCGAVTASRSSCRHL